MALRHARNNDDFAPYSFIDLLTLQNERVGEGRFANSRLRKNIALRVVSGSK
jgi:hypothetical protein